jgi:diadenylate cyclase
MDALRDIFTGVLTFRIPEIRIQDVIDILIVAWLIYRVMMWIKSTRAWSLSKGVVFVLVTFLLSNYFGFYTLTWLITNGASAGIIALIVLFQPEIRRALEDIGKNKLLSVIALTGDDEDADDITNQIADAVFDMAKVKTGALILIERKVGLGDHEKTGIKMDALFSEQLLKNIFEDKTPLHDGAVVIRGRRIAAAACILPLTQSEIGHDLGTRHRAAVGASEVSDADIIVVSEETGAVSLARQGRLYRRQSKEQILKLLEQPKHEKKKVFWKGWQGIEKDK